MSFALARPGTARLSLLDEAGREVRELRARRSYGAGSQQVPLPLDGLAAGLYLVQVETPGLTQRVKLVLR